MVLVWAWWKLVKGALGINRGWCVGIEYHGQILNLLELISFFGLLGLGLVFLYWQLLNINKILSFGIH